jgi:hypothetical protein
VFTVRNDSLNLLLIVTVPTGFTLTEVYPPA